MKITKLDTFHVKPRWMFVKICTDEGICGWGEPVLEGKSTVVEEAVHRFGDMIIGKDPDNIESLWQLMYRGGFYRGGAILCSAISGIEQALWDIKGKKLGVPVWSLLGGKSRDRIRMYAHITPELNPSIQCACEGAKKRVDQGFTALKTVIDCPFEYIDTMGSIDKYVEKFAAIRETIGKDVDIAIDFHGRISPPMAKMLCKRLEEYYPMFIEEPVLPENVDSMLEITKSTTIPIATGERIFTTFGFREIIEKKVAKVLQPDICHCGGILQAFKIAAMGENYYCSVAPHNPLGPIALAASLQIDTCIPNFIAQEHLTLDSKLDLGKGILKEEFVIKDGYIDVPIKPGLGIEVDEYNIKQLKYDGKWSNPCDTFYKDGYLAEW